MHISMDVSLAPTLSCGQAHRWREKENSWYGILGNEEIILTQTEDGFDCQGTEDRGKILEYFRVYDNLPSIIEYISKCDPIVANLSEKCPGLRILKQEPWECLATYILATNVNIKRIAKMVESVCNTFGTPLKNERCAFPTPKQIIDRAERIGGCKLGFRENRFLELANRIENKDINLDEIAKEDYKGCIKELMTINGVGPKVADCVALFGFGHLEAFPVDIRISKYMKSVYGVSGSYKNVSEYGRGKFGRYAGYAQEFLYYSDYI